MRAAFLLAIPFLIGGTAGAALPSSSGPWPDGPIVVFGDSYSSGWGAQANESFPTLLATSLGIPVINRGVGGETAAEAAPRLQRDTLAHRPRLVVVEFGTNEAFRDYPLQRCTSALDAMLTELRFAGVPVVLVGVRFGGYQGNLDAELTRLAHKHGTGLVLDSLRGVLDDPELTSDGGFHPNAEGYAIMESRIRPEVQRVLAGS